MLRSRHFIDEVLPHPDGPAILVRRPDGGDGSRYRLGLLGPEVRWYDIPSLGLDRISALRADVDGDGRIVILGAARGTLEPTRLSESALVVLEIPHGD